MPTAGLPNATRNSPSCKILTIISRLKTNEAMSDEAAAATRVDPVPGLVRLAHLIYALHALSVLMGLLAFGFGGAAIRFVIACLRSRRS